MVQDNPPDLAANLAKSLSTFCPLKKGQFISQRDSQPLARMVGPNSRCREIIFRRLTFSAGSPIEFRWGSDVEILRTLRRN
ncbi:MAG: hypothetical protein CM15mP120_10650 [Pseudomonadota bacterium]|nr:MAG: hypothetical protein CM15mP120_10650 [Pseudomonadota bacterium]